VVHPYRLDATAAVIAGALGADPGHDVWQGGTVIPGGFAPVVIRGKHRSRYLIPRQWGVPPPPRGTQVVTHVRNPDSPFWIGTLRHTEYRCLVPATSFCVTRGGRSEWLAVPGRPVIGFAGIWRDSEVPSYAIVTTEGSLAGIVSLPLILPPEHWDRWLSAEWKLAQRLVTLGHSPLDLVPA
jgi:putative SOS response-associated peptidase YedK